MIDAEWTFCDDRPRTAPSRLAMLVIAVPAGIKPPTREDVVSKFLHSRGYDVEAVRQHRLGSIYFNQACTGEINVQGLDQVMRNVAIMCPSILRRK